MKFLNKSTRVCSGIVALLSISDAVFAVETRIETATQQVQRTDLKRMLQEPAAEVVPSLYKGEEKDLGPQYVIPDQKPKHQWLQVSYDVQYASTSNVSLVESNRVESSLMISTAQIAVAPTPWELSDGTLAIQTGYRHQRFNYGLGSGNEHNLNDLDFDVSTIFAQSRYLFHENWIATFGVDYNRLLTVGGSGRYGEFYSEISPSFSLERRFQIDEKSIFTASFGAAWHVTHVDPPNSDQNDRIDQNIILSYLRALTPKLYVQPFYLAQFSEYTRGNRKDILQTIGLAVSYSINEYSALRVFTNFEARESTHEADYRKLDTGLGASLQIRF